MTAVLTDQHHIILPPDMEGSATLTAGQEYHVRIATGGVINLIPKRKHQKSLVEHLRGLQGVEIEHRRDPIPPPIEL